MKSMYAIRKMPEDPIAWRGDAVRAEMVRMGVAEKSLDYLMASLNRSGRIYVRLLPDSPGFDELGYGFTAEIECL